MSKNSVKSVFYHLTLVGVGLAIGLATGICVMLPKTQPSAALIERCRRQIEAINSLPEAECKRFWQIIATSPTLKERWAVTAAIAAIELAGENP